MGLDFDEVNTKKTKSNQSKTNMSITTESCQQGQIESLKKQLADKNKVIKTLRCELQKIYKVIHEEETPPVLKDYKKVLPLVKELKAKNRGLTILKQEAESRSFCYEADIKELKEANDTFTLGAKRTIESNCKLYQENKELKKENEELKAEEGNSRQEVIHALAEKFYKHYKENDYNIPNVIRTIGPDLGRMVDSLMDEEKKLTAENKELEKENMELKEEVYRLTPPNYGEHKPHPITADLDDIYNTLDEDEEDAKKAEEWGRVSNTTISNFIENISVENAELKKENMELSKKSNAKSDIIKNMFDRLIKDANIDDGFYIERDWGNKYIDEWNKIVSEEIQEAIKDINENNEEFEIRTNGYQFDFHYPESESESEEEEEEVVQDSKVDMEAFKKLKEDGMMPWSK